MGNIDDWLESHMKCTFFGHRDCPNNIKDYLERIIVELITENNVDTFYIGNQGNLDAMARVVLNRLKTAHPNIKIYTVLAYLRDADKCLDYGKTILPEGFENVPLRFAIDFRNRWMVKQSDYVVSYVTRDFGGAHKFYQLAQKQNKTVINIAKQ